MPQQDANFKKRTSLAIFKQTANMPAATNPVSGMFGASSIGTGAARVGGSVLRSIVRKLIPSPAAIKAATVKPVARPAPGSGLASIQRDLEFLRTNPGAVSRPAPGSKPTGSSSVGYRTTPTPGSAASRPRGGTVGTGNPPGKQLRDRK
jgi:hypothetical protein